MIQFHPTTIRLLVCLGLGIAAAAVAIHAESDAPSPLPPSASLVILPEPQLTLTDHNQADYDCGRVNALDTPQVEHRFTLRNDGHAPLTFTQFQPSCHCTSATVEKIAGRPPTESEAVDPTLPPGEEMLLKVKIILARQPAGPLTQGIFVFALGHNAPIARLQITGTLLSGLTVTPTALDFGSMKPGEIQSRKITITCDARLLSDGALPPLHFQADPQSGSATTSLVKITPESKAETASNNTTRHTASYIITVQPTQPGDVIAHLFFAPLSQAEYRGTIPHETAMDVFREMSVPVYAHVTKQ